MSLRKKAVSGIVWTYGQQFGTQFINFIIYLILARLLFPADFGKVGLLHVFITLSSILIEGGMSASIIRTKNTNSEDYNTIFLFNIVSAVIIYGLIFFLSPFIESFYSASDLSTILRVYSITIVISSFGVVQRAILIKSLNFKRETIINLPSILISGIIGIILAYKGFGVWSLVWPPILRASLNVVQLWLSSEWKPNFKFNKNKFKDHFQFGYQFTITELIRGIFANIYPIILGKAFTLKEVGLYKQADVLRLLPYSNVVSSINKVAFPLFAEIQDDRKRIIKLHEKFTLILFVILCPIFGLMIVLSKDIIVLLLTEKWIEAAPYLSILSFGSLLSVININNLNVLNARGKIKTILNIEIIDKTIFVLLLCLCLYLKFNIFYLLFAEIIRGVFSTLLKDFYCSKELKVKFGSQLKILIKPLSFSLLSSFLAFYINSKLSYYNVENFAKVFIPVLFGVVLYIVMIYIFQKKLIADLRNIINSKSIK